MELNNEVAIIEAILFLENEPINKKSISKISGLAVSIVEEVLLLLKNRYEVDYHGVELIENIQGFSFSPKEVFWSSLKEHYGKKNDDKLSKAAMETLSIIAYSQPLTRTEIENIRGVSADNMIRLLLRKDFIKEMGKKNVPGKPTLYGTTKEFLRVFKLKSIADLPKLEEEDRRRFELNG